MRLTIIADDQAVYVDGQPLTVDLSTLDPEIHAVQWYDDHGEIEYRSIRCTHCGITSKKPNLAISDLSAFQSFADGWHTEQAVQVEARAEQARLAAAPSASPTPVNVIAN